MPSNSMSSPRALTMFLLITTSLCCLQSYQYSDGSGSCQPCYYRCLTCQDNSSYCASCIDEFYLSATTSQCESCTRGCARCTSSADCQLCNSGFYLNAYGTCSLCDVGVAICTISIASECTGGYYMLSGICASCLANCQKCTGPTTCDQCFGLYYLKDNVSCIACSVNCVECNETACLSCTVGYMPEGAACSKCNGTGNMIYSTATGQCIQCPSYCDSCDSTMCYYCKEGYYLSNDSTSCLQGGSLLCRQSTGPEYTNCKVDLYGCQSFSVQQHDTSSGFISPLDVCLPKVFTSTSQFVYENRRDMVCPINNTVNHTFVSLPNYGIKVTSRILLFDPLPSSITLSADNATVTLSVPSEISSLPRLTASCGSYVSWTFNTSLSTYGRTLTYSSKVSLVEVYVESLLCSIDNCQYCTTNVDCVSCLSPYLLQFSKCLKDCDSGLYEYTQNRTCYLTCPNGTYPIQSQYKCSSCVGNCLTCSSSIVCLSCKAGFYLYLTECIPNCTLSSNSAYYTDVPSLTCKLCPFPCLTCSSNTTSSNFYCESCLTGYLYNTKCLLECPVGTYPNFAGLVVCSSCDQTTSFCSACVVNATTCTACVSGYVLYGTTCIVACPSGYYNKSSVCSVCRMPCLECIGMEYNCTACKVGALVSIVAGIGSCPAQCQIGTYANFTNSTNITCSSCNAKCSACFGPSETECITCVSNFYLDSTTCSNVCTVNSTYANSTLNLCSPCNSPCLTCSPTNGSACTSCVIGFLDQLCTLVCNSTSYPLLSGALYICTLCPAECKSCQSPTYCFSCNSPYLLLNTSCITPPNCPAGYYNDTTNLKCPLCSPPCVTCLDSAIKCLSCSANTYLVEGLSTCVKACPAGYYLNGNSCSVCSTLCSECVTTADKCTKCRIISSAQYYLYNDTCVATCPAKFYAEASNTSCAACVSPCLDCYSLFYCKSCSDNSLSLFNKVCVSQCPRGTISTNTSGTRICEVCTSNCNTCNLTVDNCTTCNANFYFLQTPTINSCVATCPATYYSDVYTGLCSKCVSPCLTCGSYSSCATCITGYNLFGTACLVDCPKTYYPSNQICQPCVSPCERCTNITTCTLCAAGYLMPYNLTSTENCLTSCVTGQYADSFNRMCQVCPYPCSNCSSATVCYNCSNGTSLFGSNCLSACPNGYFSINSVCEKCSDGCLICSTNATCSRCMTGYLLYNSSVCVATCPAATYPSVNLLLSIRTCLPCQSNCLNCTSPYNCTLCLSGLFLQQGYCKSSCSSFHYSTPNNTCLKCLSQFCMTCTNSTNCLSCFSSYLYNDSCYTACPEGSFPVLSSMTCSVCVGKCKTCTSVYTCTSCIDGYFLYQSSCIEKCPENTWTYVDSGVCAPECNLKKEYGRKYCYKMCPRTMVAEGDTCLQACPDNRYVSIDRLCTLCTQQICNQLFEANLQVVQDDPYTLVLYFNQRSEIVNLSDIKVIVSSRWTGYVLYSQSNIMSNEITDRSIKLTYNFSSLQPAEINLTIPYVSSLDSSQSLHINSFNTTTEIYSNWSGQPSLYYISAVLSAILLVILVINIISANGHYQQILDIMHIFWVLSYLQIEYPKALSTFFQGFRVAAVHAKLSIGAPYVYSFSPSKYIRYDDDINVLRSCGLVVLFGVVVGVIGAIVAIILRIYREKKEEERNKLVKIAEFMQKRIFWRYINDYLYVGIVQMGMFSAATFRNQPNKNTAGAYILSVLALGVIFFMAGLIFYVVFKALQKRKTSLKNIQGLVQDLQTDCSTLGMMHTPIIYLRKLFLIFVAGLCSTEPVYSLSLLLITSALLFVILLFYKPFISDITDYICITIQAILVFIFLLLIVYQTNCNSFDDGAKIVIGWIILVVGMIAVGGALGWWGYRTLKDFAKMVCQKKEEADASGQETPQPIIKQQKGEEEQGEKKLEKKMDKQLMKKALMDQLQAGDNDNMQQDSPSNEQINGRNNGEQFEHYDNSSEGVHQKPQAPELLMRRDLSSNPIDN